MPLPQATWMTARGRVFTPAPFLVAGIVNVTPDSFSDGGQYADPHAAVRRIYAIVRQGAHMVDIGAESTRPGAKDTGPDVEWHRLEPVLKKALALRNRTEAAHAAAQQSGAAPSGGTATQPCPAAKAAASKSTAPASSTAKSAPTALCADKAADAPRTGIHAPCPPFTVSVDTFREQTARKALTCLPDEEEGVPAQEGVDIINDISGGLFDPAMDEVLAEFKPGYVLGHCPARPDVMQRNPHYDNVVDTLLSWFTSRMEALVRRGLPEECICLDPCIGLGKNLDHNLEIIRAIPRFAALGRPLYYGVSRKSLLGEITGRGLHDRDGVTQAATALLAKHGVHIHRVHDVEDTLATLSLVQAWPL